jgi:hypothetical protein
MNASHYEASAHNWRLGLFFFGLIATMLFSVFADGAFGPGPVHPGLGVAAFLLGCWALGCLRASRRAAREAMVLRAGGDTSPPPTYGRD